MYFKKRMTLNSSQIAWTPDPKHFKFFENPEISLIFCRTLTLNLFSKGSGLRAYSLVTRLIFYELLNWAFKKVLLERHSEYSK